MASTGRRAILLQASMTKAPPAIAARAESVWRRLRRLRTSLHHYLARASAEESHFAGERQHRTQNAVLR